ncbi:phospho-sugar mutase [Planctellipticum variicoloris]|uniref:phospho-sugar mutase n=1 Tax=Planctellipticum variicoloris TaxID=3064265 RepID=UPI0030140C9D|nr:phospho-sugar mutase [Planctomycetaceae bacterium SH412]
MSPVALTVAEALPLIASAVESGRLTAPAAENLRIWLAEPQYGQYQPQLLQLVAAADFTQLDSLFWERIPFGTGGRRGGMSEFGSATINARTIGESANGLAAYVQQVCGADDRKAVIAHDTRHRSPEFARLTAEVLAAHGFQVFFFDGARATPELSFAVRKLQCDCGLMISASHNPPSDNGFKAYWSNGGQVLAPHDKGIIECVNATREIPRVPFEEAVRDGRIVVVGAALDEDYLQTVAALSLTTERDVTIVFSPLHGVGSTSAYPVLVRAGFPQVLQFEPHWAQDGGFPNVPKHLPNPELTSVFEPILPFARENAADVILATDPDADRLGVAARTPTGEYLPLTGNQVGALIIDYLCRKRAAQGTLTPSHYVVETLVTSGLIARIADSRGLRVIRDLLVGFKYIGETIDREGAADFVFGAEESLGYLAGDYARDKDASIAALYVAELAAELKAEGRSLLDQLDAIYIRYGYFLETQRSKTCVGSQGNEQIRRIMQEFRIRPPAALGGLTLSGVLDYKQHEIRSLPANVKTQELPAPSGDLLFVEATSPDGTLRVALRPSGTEPKIKFYFFAEMSPSLTLDAAKSRAREQLAGMADGLETWMTAVLQSPSH